MDESFYGGLANLPETANGAVAELPHALHTLKRGAEKEYTKLTEGTLPHLQENVQEGLKEPGYIGRTGRAAIEEAGGIAKNILTPTPSNIATMAVLSVAPELGPIGVSASRLTAAGMTIAQARGALNSVVAAADKPTPENVGHAIAQLAILAPVLKEIKTLNPGKSVPGIVEWLRGKLSGKGEAAEKLQTEVDRWLKRDNGTGLAMNSKGGPAAQIEAPPGSPTSRTKLLEAPNTAQPIDVYARATGLTPEHIGELADMDDAALRSRKEYLTRLLKSEISPVPDVSAQRGWSRP